MFVAINNANMDVFAVDKWINTNRDASVDKKISPKFAMEILTKTNYYGHIKKVLKNINDNCSDEEKKKYKDFVLASVDGREVSPQTFEMLREFAKICECEEELYEANKHLKIYDKKCCDIIKVKSKEEFNALKGDNLNIYCELSGKKVLHIVNDDYCSTFYGTDFKIDLSECDLSKVRSIRFREGVEVDLRCSKNLPEVLDFLRCSEVKLGGCDLNGVKEIKFRERSKVDLTSTKNLPEVLEFPYLSDYVYMNNCDLSTVKELKFAERTRVYFSNTKNFPEILDLSGCIEVILWRSDLGGVKEIKFGENACINLCSAKNLPEVLDFSRCSEVKLGGCDLSGVKEIKFRDRKQKRLFMNSADNFTGKVEYEKNAFSRVIDNVFNK